MADVFGNISPLSGVYNYMGARYLSVDELRMVMRTHGFRVKALASGVGLGVRTFERRFEVQFQTTPKAWIRNQRLMEAPALLRSGLSNKEVASRLSYTRESNFCRAFKQHFGSAPQKYVHGKVIWRVAFR